MVWADYGNGWQAAKKIDTSELISLDEQTLIASPSRLPFQQHLMPWVVSGQNELDDESLPPVTLLSVSLLAFALYFTNFGAVYKSEFILRFWFHQQGDSKAYLDNHK